MNKWCIFVACDGLNVLPHMPCILGVYDMTMDSFCIVAFYLSDSLG